MPGPEGYVEGVRAGPERACWGVLSRGEKAASGRAGGTKGYGEAVECIAEEVVLGRVAMIACILWAKCRHHTSFHGQCLGGSHGTRQIAIAPVLIFPSVPVRPLLAMRVFLR